MSRHHWHGGDTLVKVAELLERSQAWLINGEEEPTRHVASRLASLSRPGRLDVYASAEGGEGGALILSSRPIGSIACPDGLEGVGDAYAVLFTGKSMVPAIKPGQVGWVDPRLPPMRGEEHIFLSSRPDLGEERAMVKDWVTWTETNWRVHQLRYPLIFLRIKIQSLIGVSRQVISSDDS